MSFHVLIGKYVNNYYVIIISFSNNINPIFCDRRISFKMITWSDSKFNRNCMTYAQTTYIFPLVMDHGWVGNKKRRKCTDFETQESEMRFEPRAPCIASDEHGQTSISPPRSRSTVPLKLRESAVDYTPEVDYREQRARRILDEFLSFNSSTSAS